MTNVSTPMKKLFLLLVLVGSLVCGVAQGAIQFTAVLDGASEVPPNKSMATGIGTFTLEGNILTFSVIVEELTPSLTSYVYGPAKADSNASPIFSLGIPNAISFCTLCTNPPATYGFSSEGNEPTLTTPQIAALLAGEFYVSINTPTFPNGEIRGQILPQDSDQDGVPDYLDHCSDTAAGAAVNEHGCSIAQLCPCDGSWKNHGQYIRAVAITAADFRRHRWITV